MAEFQFTLPCRERRAFRRRNALIDMFQFTLPCRERLSVKPHGKQVPSFNSRSRVGSDGRRVFI